MNSIAHFLYPENIFLGLVAADKHEVFLQLAARMERDHHVDRAVIYKSLCERESLGTTAIGEGVAIPHARVKGLRHPMATFVRLRHPIAFNAPDDKPVSVLFALLVPGAAMHDHLQLLADVAEMMCNPRIRMRLEVAADVWEIRTLIASYDCAESGAGAHG